MLEIKEHIKKSWGDTTIRLELYQDNKRIFEHIFTRYRFNKQILKDVKLSFCHYAMVNPYLVICEKEMSELKIKVKIE